MHTLISDPRVLDKDVHDVTIVDMEDSAEPAVSEDDLSLFRLQWPVTVFGVWYGSKPNCMLCARLPRSVTETLSRETACIVASGLSTICTDMCRHSTWI